MANDSPRTGRGRVLARALLAAAGFVPRAWRRAPLALAALALALAVPALTGAAGGGVLALVGLVQLGALLLAGGALLRLGLGLPLGPGGLTFGRMELRLLASGLLCGLFLVLIAIVLGLLLVGVAGAAGLEQAGMAGGLAASAEMPAWQTGLVILLAVLALAVLLVLWARLALAWPATGARGRVVSLEALKLSRGRTAELLAGLAITGAPLVGLIAWFLAGAPDTAAADVVWAVVLAGLQAPLTLGFLSAAYGLVAGTAGGEAR